MSSIRRGRGLLASGPPRSAGAGAQTIDGQSQGSAQDTATITNLTSIKSMIPDNKNEAVAARNSGLYEEASKKSADVLVEAIKSSVQISSVSVRGMRGRGLFSGNRNIVVKREWDEMQTTDKKDIVTPASSAISGTISRPRGRGLFNGSQNIGGHRESDKTQFGWILSREDVPEVGQPAPRTDIEESTKYSNPSTLRGGFGTSTRGRGRLALGVADRRSDLEKKETVPVEPPRQRMPSTRGIPKPGFGSGFGRGASSTAAINVSGLNTLQSSTGGPENLQTGKVVAENPDWEASDEGDTDADTNKAPNIASTTIPVSRGTFGRGRGRGILANRGALTGTNQSQIDSSGQVGQQIVGERPFMAQNMDSNQASRGQQVRGFGAVRGRGRGVQTLGNNLGASQPTAVNRDQGSFNPNRQTAGDAPNRGRGFNRPNDFGDRNRTEGENNRRNDPSGGDPRTEREGEEPRPDPYVPLVRSVEEIIKEDVEQKAYYQTIADGDENVSASYSGFSSQHKHAVALDTWKDAGLEERLFRNIENCQYVRPRKIQAYSIPLILEGCDMKGLAETGSGKTAAFMVPIINIIMKSKLKVPKPIKPTPNAIVIEPTRELCKQVYEQGLKFAVGTGVNVAKAYGNYDSRMNRRELQDCGGCDILCVTPGRFMHLVCDNWIDYTKVNILVLDEADRLMELSFLDTIRKVIRIPGFPQKEVRQTLMFSATFPAEVQKLANEIMKPEFAMISKDKVVAANNKIKQEFMMVDPKKKRTVLLEFLRKHIDKAVEDNTEIPRFLIFVSKKKTADSLSIYLSLQGVKATTINADRTQNQRELALRQFILKDMYVLISTDVCSRGIDIKNMDHVINYDLPDFKGQNPKNPDDKTYDERPTAYVQRIGRTGRLRAGTAISFFDELNDNDRELADKLIDLVRGVGQEPPEFLKKTAQDYARVSSFVPSDDPWGDNEEDTSAAAPVAVATGVVDGADDWE